MPEFNNTCSLWSDEGLKVKGVASEEKYNGAIIRVYREEVELPDGSHSHWDVVRHLGAVCIVPIDGEGNVILVRQFRYPAGRVMLEIPAGKLDSKTEDPREAAIRELRELGVHTVMVTGDNKSTANAVAAAVGIDGLFLEVHDNPEEALSDGANMVYLDKLEDLLKDAVAIHEIVRHKQN